VLTLSLFPGIGLLDHGFELEGFCVVRGPDPLCGGDIRRFHAPAGRFDGIIGGPPCQAHSRLAHLVRANGYTVAEDLIPEYERVVAEAQPAWFVMENVEGAPLPEVPGYDVRATLLNNRWLGEEQNRVRRFSFGTRDGRALDLAPEEAIMRGELAAAGWAHAVTASAGGSCKPKCGGGALRKTPWKEAIRLQGLPADFDLPGFTVAGKLRAVGNGVPIPMGRAVARAVRRALELA
jgi:DNA (cytosine-5)-methyltransferase 1